MRMSRWLMPALLLLACNVPAAEIVLARNGATPYRIVLADDAIPAEVTGGRELADHLNQMTGATFPVVRAADYNGGPMIAVGFNAKLPPALTADAFGAFGPEELLITVAGDTLLLADGRPRGALYAVYEFLETLGVRWYTPTYTRVPERRDLAVDVAEIRHTSPFRTRTSVFGNGTTKEWSARNRMNSFIVWNHPGEEYGGGIKQGPDMHTFWRMLNPASFKDHPEWAAMVKGEREVNTANTHWGLCLSNAELRRYLVARTLDWVRKNPQTTHVWIGQNDGSPYCTCPDCTAFYDAHGGKPSSLIVQLINELAEAMAPEFPDKRLKTLAYGWSLDPPTGMKLADSVTVMVCAAVPHCATLGRSPEADKFLANYADWRKVASDFEVYLYSYPTDSFWFPAPCLFSQARNIQWSAANGITAVHQEVFGTGTGDGGDLSDLRAWLYIQLMGHPEADPQKLVEDFCRGYYGDNADAVLDAIARTHTSVEQDGWMPPKDNVTFLAPGYVEPDVATAVCRDLEKRYNATADPEMKKRLGYAWLPYLWADFWLGVPALADYNEKTRQWGIAMPDRDRRAKYGALIRQLMIENGVGAIRLGVKLNPHVMRLAEMTRSYPAVRLADGKASAVVVPGCYGKVVDFRAADGFMPIKPAWGYSILEYPRIGYGREILPGGEVAAYTLAKSDKTSATLTGRTGAGAVTRLFEIKDGVLRQAWQFKAEKPVADAALRIMPMYDLNPDVLGIYPVLHVGLAGGGWRAEPLGRAGSMWYQAAGINLDGVDGRFLLVAEDGRHAVRFDAPRDRLASLSYMYDRYDFQPKGTGRVLELSFITAAKNLAAGDTAGFALEQRILDGDAAAQLLENR